MKSKADARWEPDPITEHLARLDQSLRRMDRWMAILMSLYVIARLAIWKLL